jgi:DNA-binding MarR family transcriptional regulator
MEVALAEFDITPAQFLLLFRLRDSQDISAAALARDIGVRPQSIGEIIGPLERKRLLKREASPDNRRILHTRVTAAGHKLLAEGLRIAGRVEAELLQELTDEQLATTQQALTQLWERAEEHEMHPGSIRARADEQRRAQLSARQRRGLRAAARRSQPAKSKTA